MSTRSSLFLCLILLSSFGICSAASAEQAHDRVVRSGTLRCGYAVWPGLVEKDPNTQKLSGLFVEFMEELGRVAELKIEWTGEYGWGDFIEALNSNKIDAMCAGIWTNAVRGKHVLFSQPMAFQSVVPIVRADDTRFDADIDTLNDPSARLVISDGESAQSIATTDFPRATLLSLPQRSDAALMIANVVHKKGDATFVDVYTAKDFQAKNPGKIKIVPTRFPVRVFGITVAISKSESALKAMLDTATQQLLWTGRIDRLLKKHEKIPGAYVRAALPFITE